MDKDLALFPKLGKEFYNHKILSGLREKKYVTSICLE